MLRYGLVVLGLLVLSPSLLANDIAEAQDYLNRKKEQKVGATHTSADKTLCPLARISGKGIPSLKELVGTSPSEGAKDV